LRPKGGDASACLNIRPSVIRRDLTIYISRVMPSAFAKATARQARFCWEISG